MVGNEWALDSFLVTYYWEHPFYPQFVVPLSDIRTDVVPAAALQTVAGSAADERLVVWNMLDRWFEEDEEIFVHPRSPYVRVDAIRSSRRVRVEHAGVVLAEASSCVVVFETGLPPRYYLDKTAIDWSLLTSSETVSQCPYKGTTSGYWNASVDGETTADVAWGYDVPTTALGPIAGLVAFYDDRVTIVLD